MQLSLTGELSLEAEQTNVNNIKYLDHRNITSNCSDGMNYALWTDDLWNSSEHWWSANIFIDRRQPWLKTKSQKHSLMSILQLINESSKYLAQKTHTATLCLKVLGKHRKALAPCFSMGLADRYKSPVGGVSGQLVSSPSSHWCLSHTVPTSIFASTLNHVYLCRKFSF